MTDENKIQEMQMLEQNLQNTLLQKQAFQMELAETQAALSEIEKAGDEVFKVIGQLMIKSDKKTLKEELSKKKDVLELRMKALEKQETVLVSKSEELREDIMKTMEKSKK